MELRYFDGKQFASDSKEEKGKPLKINIKYFNHLQDRIQIFTKLIIIV